MSSSKYPCEITHVRFSFSKLESFKDVFRRNLYFLSLPMNSQMTFEDLPNEIITEVFEYFTFDELCQTFSSLNGRLDVLLSNDQHRQIVLRTPEDCARHLGRYLLPKRLTVSVAHSKKFFEPGRIFSTSKYRLFNSRTTDPVSNGILFSHDSFLISDDCI